LAAWYLWTNHLETFPRIDSCAIILIGPCEGIRMTYDCSVLGINAPERPSRAWRNMELVTADDKGREIAREPFEIRTFSMMGSGFPLASYRPQHTDTMKQLVTWAFEGVTKNESPAVVGAMRASAPGDWRNKIMFPWTVDKDLGSISWTWPSMPPCRQKLIDIKMFDPQSQYFKRGGHMPLMVFVGGLNQQRRTKGACERRERRAEQRGWGAKQRGSGKGWSRGNDWRQDSGDAWRAQSRDDAWHAWSSDGAWHAWSSDGAWHAWSSDDIDNWRGAWNSDDNWRGAWSNR
jgi:hypothetical protein